MLDLIHKGKRRKPPRVILYGPEGIGKSTFGNTCPDPVFLPTEDGLGEIDCHSFPKAANYGEFVKYLGVLCEGGHGYKTAVVDTADWLEKLIWAEVSRKNGKASIEEIGYAKGYQLALELWKEVLSGFDYLRDQGMNVVVLAHAKIEKFNDPESNPYDRYTLRLHKDADAYLREWADAVFFAHKKVRVENKDMGFNKVRSVAKAVGADGGDRVMRTVGGPTCTAKNRYGITDDLPLSWEAFEKYLAAA